MPAESQPDWTLIRSFLAVAQAGSLSAAARALGATQPTIGRHVGELEAALGVILFERRRDGFRLTEKGLALCERAEPMQEAAAAFSRLAEGSAGRMEGTVRLTASEVMAAYALPPMLARLALDEPGIEVEIIASNQIGNLLARDADIAIRMVRPVQNDLVVRHVGDLPLAACAAKTYLARAGRPQIPQDLAGHRLIGWDRADDIIRGFSAFGVPVDRHTFATRTDNQIVFWEAIKAGLGVGFAQASLVAREPGVEALLPDLPLPVLPMWLAIHEDLRTSPRIRRVLDFLHAELKAYSAI